jgi:hypothetical protein
MPAETEDLRLRHFIAYQFYRFSRDVSESINFTWHVAGRRHRNTECRL